MINYSALKYFLQKNKKITVVLLILLLTLLTSVFDVKAATSPSLGIADTFGVLASTYTNTVVGTTINGGLGYTTPPFVPATVNGNTHIADSDYNQAGIDQGAALVLLNNEACTFTFAPGAVDLAANADFPTAIYSPGVYCITGATSIGTGGITLNGNGTYIFKTNGTLNTAANSHITILGGASACDIWWAPTTATTLGANSSFEGTVIDDAGITIGTTVTWVGRALSFGGTVTSDTDTITVPTCGGVPPPVPSATLTLTKTVINDNGGVKAISDFPLFINGIQLSSGIATTTLTPGTYTATETGDAEYIASIWGGDCAADGSITLVDGDDKECTITNDDIEPAQDNNNSNGGSRRRTSSSPAPLLADVVATSTNPIPAVATTTITIINNSIIPKLPNAGFGPQ